MSGGYFNYIQEKFSDPLGKLDDLIYNGGVTCDGEIIPFDADILDKVKMIRATCDLAGKALERLDRLVSGDDGEDSFRERWNEEIRIGEMIEAISNSAESELSFILNRVEEFVPDIFKGEEDEEE